MPTITVTNLTFRGNAEITMIFVEHDARFCEKIANKVVRL
jgi:ABC-type polar amino acid transport system ATPase subunit